MPQRRYAQGQIIVVFKGNKVGEETAKLLGEKIGLLFIENTDDYYVYKTKKGYEKKAVKKFEKKYPEFVEWADRRDILYETRYKKLESIGEAVSDLREGYIGFTETPSKREFNNSLDELIRKIERAKE